MKDVGYPVNNVTNTTIRIPVRFTRFLSGQWNDNDGFSYVLPCMTAAACFLCTLIFDKTVGADYTGFILACMCVIAGIVGGLLLIRRRLTERQILIVIYLISFLLRLGYVLYTSIGTRQHDVGTFMTEDGIGHAAYIEWFYYNGLKLPEISGEGAFYHPPLHHILAAVWMHLLTALGMSYERAAAGISFLTLFYTSCCSIVTERILSALDVQRGGQGCGLCHRRFPSDDYPALGQHQQ